MYDLESESEVESSDESEIMDTEEIAMELYQELNQNSQKERKRHNSQQVNFMRDQTEHDHNYQNLNKRLRKEIKNRIIELYKIGVTAPLNIIYTLRKDGNVNLPSQKQISNFIARKKKNLKGENQIKFCELASWCAKNCSLPDDQDQAFVLDYQVSSEKKNDPYIRLMMSTKYLLSIASKE
ncbi:unnamed protein product [Brachionus calyciflorus]|uniref:Uncharacterized protein n=1 Tax=Brachionus calyciflorus TaxID=104777 RepID=A0A813ZE94_9BILA|nr:unnamed protein product [Brachionus calyciflorus]